MAQKILVAEDEMIVALDLCETVEEAGFQVDGPHSGISAAMLAFQKQKPDLAILDIALSDGEVLNLARTFMAEDIPVIFHTASREVTEVAQSFPRAWALPKPCPPTDMLEAVSHALEINAVDA